MRTDPYTQDKIGQAWVSTWLKGRQGQLQENISDPDREKNIQGIERGAYHNSPWKRSMLNRSSALPNAADETAIQLKRLSTPELSEGVTGNRTLAYYDPTEIAIKYNKGLATKYPETLPSTFAHERTHAAEATPQLAKIYGLQQQYGIKKQKKYLQDPGETYSRLNELRMDMGLKPGDVVTPDMLLKNQDKVADHDFEKYDMQYTLDLLNKVAETKAPSTGPSIAPPTQMASTGGLLRHVSAVMPKTIPSAQSGTVLDTTGSQDTLNDRALKSMMKEKMATRAFINNEQKSGTIGGLMSTKLSTVSPDRKLPQMDNPDVGKVRTFAESISRPEMKALLNTTANPFGKSGWLKNIVFNPDVHITMDKVAKAGSAAKGLFNLNKQGYKFTIGGTLSAAELKDRRNEELNPNYSHG